MIKEYKPLIFFLLKALSLFILWLVIEAIWLPPGGYLNGLLTESETFFVDKLLHFIGFNSTYGDYFEDACAIYFDGQKVLGISDSCNGQVLFALFAGFIVAYPSKWKVKLWYIPMGMLVIYVLNIIRLFCLVLISYYHREYLDFNHHYTFTILVYMDVFFLWMAFVNNFGSSIYIPNSSSKDEVNQTS